MLGFIFLKLLKVHPNSCSSRTSTTQTEYSTGRIAICIFKVENETLFRCCGSIDRVSIAVIELEISISYRIKKSKALILELDTYENSSPPTILIPDSSAPKEETSPLTKSLLIRSIILFAASLSTAVIDKNECKDHLF